VAEGRYVCFNDRPEVADVALLVVDQMQRRGIGTLLVENLTEIARRNGVTRLSADVLADNRGMLSLLRKTRFPVSSAVSQGVMHFELRIAPEEIDGIPAAA
jgi:GNAT superfamily N-acetyltransferase